jgi:hypothetical protein
MENASGKDRSSKVADAIPSSRSLTSAAFRSADSSDEMMKIALLRILLTYDKVAFLLKREQLSFYGE